MTTASTLLRRRIHLPLSALLGLMLILSGWQCPARAQGFTPDHAWKTQETTPPGRIVWQHVGRVYINPTNGQFVYVGYLVHIDPIHSSLFNGSPSESTAYFTFSTADPHSTDVAYLTPLPNNGDVALDFVSAGTFNVYYNSKPDTDWGNPASFSSGNLIATFARKESLFAEFGPVSFQNLSETLMSSHSFTFDGQTYNFNRIAPNGITFMQFFSTVPQAGTTDYAVTFAGAGTVFAVGIPEER